MQRNLLEYTIKALVQMKRQDYQKPTTTIVKLQQSSILMQSPQGDAEDYEKEEERNW
jgi:hypothetical protein